MYEDKYILYGMYVYYNELYVLVCGCATYNSIDSIDNTFSTSLAFIIAHLHSSVFLCELFCEASIASPK